MADPKPIITKVKDAFDVVISAIPDIAEVQVFPIIATDIETANMPYTAIFDLPQEHNIRNRLEENQTIMHIETWYHVDLGKENLTVKGDYLEAIIHDALMNDFSNGVLHTLLQKAEKQPPERAYQDEDSLGTIIQTYLITFFTKFGDSFSQTKY